MPKRHFVIDKIIVFGKNIIQLSMIVIIRCAVYNYSDKLCEEKGNTTYKELQKAVF